MKTIRKHFVNNHLEEWVKSCDLMQIKITIVTVQEKVVEFYTCQTDKSSQLKGKKIIMHPESFLEWYLSI